MDLLHDLYAFDPEFLVHKFVLHVMIDLGVNLNSSHEVEPIFNL